MDFTNVFFTHDLLFRLDHNQNIKNDKDFKYAENFLQDLILKNFDQFRNELEKDVDVKYFPLSIELVLNETGYRDRSIGYRNRIENRYELLEINIIKGDNVSKESEIGVAHLQLAMRKAIQKMNNDSHYFNELVYGNFLDLLKEMSWGYSWPLTASKSDKFTYKKEFKSIKDLNKEFTKIISFFEDNLRNVKTQDFVG